MRALAYMAIYTYIYMGLDRSSAHTFLFKKMASRDASGLKRPKDSCSILLSGNFRLLSTQKKITYTENLLGELNSRNSAYVYIYIYI